MLTFDELGVFVEGHVPEGEIRREEHASPKALIIPPTSHLRVCNALHDDPSTYFDMLSCLTGIDNGPEPGTIEIAYNLYSIPFDHHLMLKVILPRDKPEIESVTSIWKTADWHEREAFDLFGITFLNHPDLRRLLMPADWEGFPLRKDYKNVAYYRGIRFEY